MPIHSTSFPVRQTINCRGKLLDLSRPRVMGILNVTPDSFYDGGNNFSPTKAIDHALQMVNDGADIIDIGGQSTRPKSQRITAEEEWSRVESVLKEISKHFDRLSASSDENTLISIDTYYSFVADRALDNGVSIVNDISAGAFDKEIFTVAAKYKSPYILMHMQGTPDNMQEEPKYDDVVYEVFNFFKDKLQLLHQVGVNDIILDSGFGFGKNVEHNYSLLKHLRTFQLLGYPVMAGLSRKSMINKVLNTKAVDALNGTTALNMLALQNGASILRVHDVTEAVQAVKLWKQYDVTV